MRAARRWVGLFLLAGATAVVIAVEDSPVEVGARQRVHPERGAAERELVAIVQALIRDDGVPARAAMERLKTAVRAVSRDEGDLQGPDVVVHSQAFHAALNRARESVSAGQTQRAFDDFYWVQRSCRQCHDAASRKGVVVFPGQEPAAAAAPHP